MSADTIPTKTKENPLITRWKDLHAWWEALPQLTATLILDWLIVAALAILVMVIYVPRSIWAEEEAHRSESRRRMTVIQKAEDIYHSLTGHFSQDGEFMFRMVSQVHDSLIADSTFIGTQVVHLGGRPYEVDISEGLDWLMDTTFSVGRPVKVEFQDTTYTILSWNYELADNDTIHLNGKQALMKVSQEERFRGVIDTTYGSHTEVLTDYKLNRYKLEPKLLHSPIIDKPYLVSISEDGLELTVTSPVQDTYKEWRFGIFRYKMKNPGEIVAGTPNW